MTGASRITRSNRSLCQQVITRSASPSRDENSALAASDKATVQARLERAFVEFER